MLLSMRYIFSFRSVSALSESLMGCAEARSGETKTETATSKKAGSRFENRVEWNVILLNQNAELKLFFEGARLRGRENDREASNTFLMDTATATSSVATEAAALLLRLRIDMDRSIERLPCYRIGKDDGHVHAFFLHDARRFAGGPGIEHKLPDSGAAFFLRGGCEVSIGLDIDMVGTDLDIAGIVTAIDGIPGRFNLKLIASVDLARCSHRDERHRLDLEALIVDGHVVLHKGRFIIRFDFKRLSFVLLELRCEFDGRLIGRDHLLSIEIDLGAITTIETRDLLIGFEGHVRIWRGFMRLRIRGGIRGRRSLCKFLHSYRKRRRCLVFLRAVTIRFAGELDSISLSNGTGVWLPCPIEVGVDLYDLTRSIDLRDRDALRSGDRCAFDF